MNKSLSYLNDLTLIIKESKFKACIVVIDKHIPTEIQSLINNEGKINGVKVYTYNDEYYAPYKEMSQEFKAAYIFKDGSIYVYDFKVMFDSMGMVMRMRSEKGLRPSNVFIDEAID